MSFISKDQLLAQLQWRYATKKFDSKRKIPAETWASLRDAVVLSPSSYGLQPWRLVDVRDPALRKELQAVSWNQPQIVEASHLVVFAVPHHLTAADVAKFIAQVAKVRGVPVDSLTAYSEMMLGDLINGPRKGMQREWAARQAYIALGTLLMSAALLGVDACPMEGFDPQAYSRILGLEAKGFSAVVVCALGYRDASDQYAAAAKVRFPAEQLIESR